MQRTFSDFSGRKGLVLGLANESSIAAAVVRRLHGLGADLCVSCLNDKARPFASQVTDPLNVMLMNCDVDVPGELDDFVSNSVARLGGLDFVVHSIAWAPAADLKGRVVDSSRDGFAKAMSLSCHSFVELAHLVLPHLNPGASLVTMSYHGAEEVVPGYGIMGPVKAALESTVRYLASELGPQGIRVHAVSPGPILTRAASGIPDFEGLMGMAIERSPLRRLVNIDEVANLTAFLCASESSGMTGQTLYVDGGFHFMA